VTLLDIRVLGDPILRAPTVPVTAITDELRTLVDRMFETMYAAQGIGLAAPQVGRSERLSVIDVDRAPLVIVNPQVVGTSGSDKAEEGCLSIPDVYGDVQRPDRVRVQYLDMDLQPREIEAEGLLARCLQHEIDHLDGKLFIDYLSVIKRRSAMTKWQKEKDKYPGQIRTLTAPQVAEHHHRNEEL
jgi:peptide deformylase